MLRFEIMKIFVNAQSHRNARDGFEVFVSTNGRLGRPEQITLSYFTLFRPELNITLMIKSKLWSRRAAEDQKQRVFCQKKYERTKC